MLHFVPPGAAQDANISRLPVPVPDQHSLRHTCEYGFSWIPSMLLEV